ncbi:MAG TPA: adenosine kinase [Acidimicrobiales bacterium]|nr:adenosine kinase [Acidimicrobiales bacterium]
MPERLDPPPLPEGGRRPVDVVAVGHALVDRLAEVPTEQVAASGMELGAMTLVDGEAAAAIERSVGAWQEAAGGSAANTAAGVASLGGTAAFAGSVGDDEAGRRYVADLEAAGVLCVAVPAGSGEPTGVSHVLVTPGGERSMATSLAAAAAVSPAAVEGAGVERASVVYLEGYLLDAPSARQALERAVELARRSGTLVALSLSDRFVVERHRSAIAGMVQAGEVDVLFGNEEETLALTGERDLPHALGALGTGATSGMLVYVTRGPRGSVAARGAERAEVPPEPVRQVVDTTGAGDLFAAGVLFGLTNGHDAVEAARIGSLAAAEVIGHLGARPHVRLSGLLGG